MKTTADVLHFEEAIAYFEWRLDQAGYLPDVEGLLEDTLQEARVIASTAQLDLANAVYGGIEDAIAKGETFADFKMRIEKVLNEQWGGLATANAHRLETIFRTNVQRAYSAGRITQYSDPDILETRPVWKFSAIMDSRTSEICTECDGTVLPATHRWWQTHQPPLHHNCRSTVIALSKKSAEVVGITKNPPKEKPEEGFGNVVREFRPDLKEYPRELAKAYKGNQK